MEGFIVQRPLSPGSESPSHPVDVSTAYPLRLWPELGAAAARQEDGGLTDRLAMALAAAPPAMLECALVVRPSTTPAQLVLVLNGEVLPHTVEDGKGTGLGGEGEVLPHALERREGSGLGPQGEGLPHAVTDGKGRGRGGVG